MARGRHLREARVPPAWRSGDQLFDCVWIALKDPETLTVGDVVPPWIARVQDTFAVMLLVLDGAVAASGIETA